MQITEPEINRLIKSTDYEMLILYNLCLVVSFSVSAHGQNDVRKPPSITKDPDTKVIFREHQEVTLTCKAEGIPAVTYVWKRNGEYLNLINTRIRNGSEGNITIVNATQKDDGYYQCFATNQYGTALSTVAQIQMAFFGRSSQSVNVNVTVQEGRPFVIPAATRNSFPTPTYSWEIRKGNVDPNPLPFDQSRRVHSACNGDLNFAYALKEDELGGNFYKSTLFNANTDERWGGSYTRIMVTQGSGDVPDFPPNITHFSKSQEVALIGGKIELECFFSGKPLPNITWSRSKNNLPSGRNNISHYGTKLTISNIGKSDEGDYVCTAKNAEGTTNHTHYIRVGAVPAFTQESDGPRNVNVTEGESITFNCSAFAIPEATVVWLRNGQPIDVTKAPVRFVFSNDNKSLTIRDVCRDCVNQERQTDLMVIQCNSSNLLGYAFASGYLNVLLRTKVTLQPNSTSVSVDLTKENRFQFTCSATSDPSTPLTIRWYKVGYLGQELVYDEPPYVIVMNGNLTMYTEPNCSTACDKYLGEYMCVGDNGYTQDTATVILNSTTGSTSSGILSSTTGSISSGILSGTTVTKAPERSEFSNTLKSLTTTDVSRNSTDRENKTDQCNASNDNGYVFNQRNLNVSNTSCNNATDNGRTISEPCPGNTTGWCSRECLLDNDAIAYWSQPNLNGCFDKEFSDLLETLWLTSCLAHNVHETSQKNQTADIASQLAVLTNKSEGLSPGNLNASVMMINGLAVMQRRSKYSPHEKEIKSVIQAASNVLRPINSKAWKELEEVNKTVATDILFLFDVYGKSLSNRNISEHIIKEKDSLVLEAWSFEKSNLPLQIEFPNRSLWGENRGDGISISMDTLNSSISSENQSTLNMWGVYYRTIHDYLPGNKDNDVSSRVLSFSIDGLKTNETLKPPVLITLRHNQVKRKSFQRTCAFWNFDRGEWDSTGCSMTSTNATHTICSCNHLTNFAILMSLKPSDDKWLPLISIIGCSISVAALILTIIVYALTWKHSKSSRAAILLNLCVALIIAYIILMAGGDKFKAELYSKDGCTAVAVLLHYFFLAAFFIMLIEGIEMVLYMFFVFHVRRTTETVMLIATAWVLPLIVVGVSLGSTKLEGYGHKEACWLSVEKGLIWAFVGPVLCIIAVNFVILILVLRLVSQKKDLLAKDRKKRDEIRATIWNLSVTCPVLGLGWLFGVFSVAFDSVVFQYLFVIANSLQGLIIFIIYALFYNKQMNEKISSLYSNYICRCRITYTQMTSTQEQSTLSRATTQTSSAQDQSTCSVAANDSGEAIPMTPAQEQSTSSKAATQMASTQEQSTSSESATQIASAQEKSTSSRAATQMTSAQELSKISKAATEMTLAQEQSTSSKAATQMTSTQEQSTSSEAAIQMTPTQEKSTISIAATQMTSAQENSTSLNAATPMTSAQDQSTNSTAANKKSHKTGFGGVPTAFKFCEEMRSHGNFHSPGTQLLSIEDSDTFESTH